MWGGVEGINTPEKEDDWEILEKESSTDKRKQHPQEAGGTNNPQKQSFATTYLVSRAVTW